MYFADEGLDGVWVVEEIDDDYVWLHPEIETGYVVVLPRETPLEPFRRVYIPEWMPDDLE